MRLTSLLLAAACLVLISAAPAERVSHSNDAARFPASLTPAGVEPAATMVAAGDPAPDVVWDRLDSGHQRLRDLRSQGSVLLVFEPDEEQLLALERDRGRLLELRVIPAAVLDRGASSTRTLARRLGLHFMLIPDPQGAIASQFNVLDPATARTAPGWFVVDRAGKVRALDRGAIPDGGYVRLAAAALALPASDAALPSSTR